MNFNSESAIFTSSKDFNILDFSQMNKYLIKKKIKYLIHVAGLSRPMSIHENNISKSINLNIIGTANIVKVCKKNNIKLIYISTNYVYPGVKGNYNENSPLKPFNNYAWSKLGGEASVQLYKNSLILRVCMTDFPFTHKKAITGAKTSFMFNKYVAKIIPLILDEKGILNIGGKKREIINFANKFSNKRIASIHLNKIKNYPKDTSLNINKLKKLLIEKKLNISDYIK
tara:strand:+ start:622 stop:1305 length:684 start_codon:yes stop_codon:yes gene_type:complete